MERPRILCVDDEPEVLAAMSTHLRRGFEVTTAGSGAEGLERVKAEKPFAIVMSDLRMPGMDGSYFLGRVRESAPDSVRVLLTGQADLEAAIGAVNKGYIFRFLTKPCPPPVLLAALDAALEQHRLVTAERVLLEETLHGSIKALCDILALANPAAFGRANRAKEHAARVAHALSVPHQWQIEAAALLSQIGCITLPPQVVQDLYLGKPLGDSDRELVARLPSLAEKLLGAIPRLEGVRAILLHMEARYDGKGSAPRTPRGLDLPIGARILKVVLDFDLLDAQGLAPDVALSMLKGREGLYDPRALATFGETLDTHRATEEVRELPLRDLRYGMVLAQDITTQTGMLLVARGHQVTAGLLERLRNFDTAGIREPIRVVFGASEKADHA